MNDSDGYNLIFDTSAIVKRYYPEEKTEYVDNLIECSNLIVISTLSVVETVSAFHKKYRQERNVTSSDIEMAMSVFFADCDSKYTLVSTSDERFPSAIEVIRNYGQKKATRTLDSIQLAIALDTSDMIGQMSFVCADEKLSEIAEEEGLHTIDVMGE